MTLEERITALECDVLELARRLDALVQALEHGSAAGSLSFATAPPRRALTLIASRLRALTISQNPARVTAN